MYGGHQDDVTAPWKTWPEFIEHEFKLDQRLKQLQAVDLIDEATATHMADLVLPLGTGREPRLNHGDLRLKNVLVDSAGRINAIIDWENAVAAPAPEWELALALHARIARRRIRALRWLDLKPRESSRPAMTASSVEHRRSTGAGEAC
jgi:aminoglycoside phosphotransferase (APT) family kinase protein